MGTLFKVGKTRKKEKEVGSRAGRGKTSLLGSLEGIDFRVLNAETRNLFFWQLFNMQGKLVTNFWL